jgi:hypothetical protein
MLSKGEIESHKILIKDVFKMWFCNVTGDGSLTH